MNETKEVIQIEDVVNMNRLETDERIMFYLKRIHNLFEKEHKFEAKNDSVALWWYSKTARGKERQRAIILLLILTFRAEVLWTPST